jgi:IS30 family transposase
VCAAVLVERKTRFFIFVRIKDKTAAMNEAVIQAFIGLPPEARKTITYDNGLENALHDSVNLELGVKSFLCKPAWEKGSIENRNGVLRRYFPKNTIGA